MSATSLSPVGPKDVDPPSLLVAALGSKMLKLAGTLTDGTLTWMTGRQTIATHVAPTINEAASEAGRPAPRIVCALPICVTSDIEGAKARGNEIFKVYGTLPSYAAMLEKEGVSDPAGVAILGSSEQVREQVSLLAEAGVTEFSGNPFGEASERAVSYTHLPASASKETCSRTCSLEPSIATPAG